MKYLFMCALIAVWVAIPAFALPEGGEPSADPCLAEQDHVSERLCLEKTVALITVELNIAEASVRKKILALEGDEKWKLLSLELFEKSVRAFGSYMASTCEVDAMSAFGGNGTHDMRLSCQEKLMKERLNHLQDQEWSFRG